MFCLLGTLSVFISFSLFLPWNSHTQKCTHNVFHSLSVPIKHHSFPVPVSENETGNFIFFFPNFETVNLFPKNYSRKPETFLGKPGKPGKPLCFSLSLVWITYSDFIPLFFAQGFQKRTDKLSVCLPVMSCRELWEFLAILLSKTRPRSGTFSSSRK
jgi:hypothetical protein